MARLIAVKCPNCGANLRVDPEWAFATCEYCRASSFVQTERRKPPDPAQNQLVIDLSSHSNRVVVTIVVGVVGILVIAFAAVLTIHRLRASAARSATTALPVEVVRTIPTFEPRHLDALNASQAAQARTKVLDLSKDAAATTPGSGSLDRKVIAEVVKRNSNRVRMCYERALATTPGIAGTVRVRFVIGADGSVASVSDGGSDVPDDKLTACILATFAGLRFPAPEGGPVTVNYPVVLRESSATPR